MKRVSKCTCEALGSAEVEALKRRRHGTCTQACTPLLHVKEHGLQRAARSPSARGERWRARPGCGGERGRETNRPCRSALHGPPPPQLEKESATRLPSLSSSHTGTPQSDEIDWFDMILLYYEKKTEQMNFKNLAPMFASKFASSPHWSIRTWLQILAGSLL